MTMKSSPSIDPVVDKLLNYFSRRQDENPSQIAHPDPLLNKLVRDQFDRFREAAVLIPVMHSNATSESKIVLTVRSGQVSSHAGQISLPGGTRESLDRSIIDTALRESEEEIGLNSSNVRVLGQLGKIYLASGFEITPVVGLIESEPKLAPCPVEVDEIFLAPSRQLLNKDAYSQVSMPVGQEFRTVLETYYGEFRIWGATAAILYHLAKQLNNC